MGCPKCKSNDITEKNEDGDTYFECLSCGYIVKNGVESRRGGT